MKTINGSFFSFFFLLSSFFSTVSYGMAYKTEHTNNIHYIVIEESLKDKTLESFLGAIFSRVCKNIATATSSKIGLDYGTQFLAYFNSLQSNSDQQVQAKRLLSQHAIAIATIARLSGIKVCYAQQQDLDFIAPLLEPHITKDLESVTMKQVMCDAQGRAVLNIYGGVVEVSNSKEKQELPSITHSERTAVEATIVASPTPVRYGGSHGAMADLSGSGAGFRSPSHAGHIMSPSYSADK